MTSYPKGRLPVITGVFLAELNLVAGGDQPRVMYGIAYTDKGGHTMGMVRSNTLSPDALKILKEFTSQVERDFIELSSTSLHDGDDLSDPAEVRDSLVYPTP